MAITRVWIEEGCISCSLCMDIVPEVFDVPDGEDCVIQPCATEHFKSRKAEIVDACEDCPVEVIQFEQSGDSDGE